MAMMKILFATAELAPVARVGGMAEACAGLVKQLRADGHKVDVLVPDYEAKPLRHQSEIELDVPEWVGGARARTGHLEGFGEITLVDVPGIAKPHPYNEADGQAFEDNDRRFFGFSAAIAARAEQTQPDILHLNDWHTAAAAGLTESAPPTVLTIHTLGYQGATHSMWLEKLVRDPFSFAWYGGTNPLVGGIALADRVVTVSPNYANEILTPEAGMGVHEQLAARGDDLVGIVNGIDTHEWNPESDPDIAARFSLKTLDRKAENRAHLLERVGLNPNNRAAPVFGMVTRLVEQKGVDLLLDAARFLENIPAQLVVLGSGDAHLGALLDELTATSPERVAFHNGYDATLSHQVFAGADLLLMPSRFEPCGLAQMQAMAYGTIPVVTDVGGLRDTVVDDDLNLGAGNGIISQSVDAAGLVDALYRADRAWASPARRRGIQERGMRTDWSWAQPAKRYAEVYAEIV